MLQTSSVIRNKIRYTAIGTSWVHTCKGFEGQSLSAPMATLYGHTFGIYSISRSGIEEEKESHKNVSNLYAENLGASFQF